MRTGKCKYQFNNIKWLERIHKNSDHWNISLQFEEDAGKGEKQPRFFSFLIQFQQSDDVWKYWAV